MSSEQFDRPEAQSAEPSWGNGRERLDISSGYAVIIDQFMLGNDQFFTSLESCGDLSDLRAAELKLKQTVFSFGGCLLPIESAPYSVLRDAEKALMLLSPGGEDAAGIEDAVREQESAVLKGRVLVDTRCVVFADAAILANRELLLEYQRLRRAGEDKRGRDMLRERGAAVRYGFQKYGDELGVFELPRIRSIALWPDVVEAALI